MDKESIRALLRPFKVQTVSRLALNYELKKAFKKLKPGKVLDIGAKRSPYKKYIPHKEFLTMDLDPKFKPDIVSDIHDIKAPKETFDTVIATEILEHCQDPKKAVKELHRVLKKGGVCILSTRFIERYHPGPYDFYRFTWDSLKDIFTPFYEVKIIPLGNRLHVFWNIISVGYPFTPLALFNPIIAKINFKKTKFPTGFLVIARK